MSTAIMGRDSIIVGKRVANKVFFSVLLLPLSRRSHMKPLIYQKWQDTTEQYSFRVFLIVRERHEQVRHF